MRRRRDGRAGRKAAAPRSLLWLVPGLLGVGLVAPSASLAVAPAPHWSIVSQSEPTYFSAGDAADAYTLVIRNDGAAATTPGSVVTVTDTLPAGVTATKISASGEGANGVGSPRFQLSCPEGPLMGTIACTYEEDALHGPLPPGVTIVVTITVEIPGAIQALAANSATVSGGGAPSASTSETTPIESGPIPFGLSYFELDVAEANGEAATEAGSHPYELTASLAFNVSSREVPLSQNAEVESPLADAAPKDVEVLLPSGLVGNPNAGPKCSQQAFLEREALNCPLDTQVGTIRPSFYGAFAPAAYPVYDVVPPPGQPAELGFSVANVGHVPVFFHVRSDGDYGLTMQLANIPETGPLHGAILTLWGIPAEAGHDLEREGTIGEGHEEQSEFCKPSVEVEGGVETQHRCPSDAPATPFLTLPSQCQAGQLEAGVLSDSWESPGDFLEVKPVVATAITGCERLSFNPTLAVTPETTQADAPSGYTIEVRVPQNEDPSGLATPDLRRAVVTLPVGAVVSPSAANGLQGCSQAQFALHSLASAACPSQSQIGTVQITTPWLASPLEGKVFLAQPECAPCTAAQAQEGRLLRLLLQAQGSGVTAKLEGSASINQSTGQLTVTFDQVPQLPFEALKLTLDGGSRAPLANPSTCGAQLTASSSLTPYSSETPATPSSAPFEVSGCPAPRFQPSFVAGTTNNQAGAFSPLTMTLSRTDQDEDLGSLAVRLPPGLLGMIANVPLCPAALAQAGSCPARSEIGGATIGAGPGAGPLFIEGGRVYLTGPDEGAPFGLSIVVPAVAGPFDLGTIVLGAQIHVNPSTAALTISSGALPQSLDGIPLQLKTVNLDIDRERFIFNPTDCGPLAVEGVAQSSAGAAVALYSPFQAANCATLPFKPKLTALTHAKTSKAAGAYLHMRIAAAPGQANIAKVKIDLPGQLPVRLTTLQKACAAAVIQVDPARCPAASVVGSVTILTPVLEHGLVGPVYLVSEGGGAFPEIEFVLQGEGVTLDVIGQTTIKHGMISAIFRSLPDVPISTLGLVLDESRHSLLAADLPAKARRSMCGQSLSMPTAITGQNGAVVKQVTRITVSGCLKRRRKLHT
jgi:uncharacterized repeat protein (TIGR01451 family)